MTRTAIYSLQDNTLTERPAMEKPIAPERLHYKRNDQKAETAMHRYYAEMIEYNKAVAQCRTIPAHDSARSLWKDGQKLVDGKDYRIQLSCSGNFEVCERQFRCSDCTPIAFPLPVKSEQNEDEFQDSIDSMDDASRIFVDKSMAIGNRIVEVMEIKGLKQKDLAQLMDKTESEVSRMLGGMHNLTLRMIAKIEAALEYDIICIPEAK